MSDIVGFLLFVRPALETLAGRPVRGDRTLAARPLAKRFVHAGDRPTYHPARRLDGEPLSVEPLDWAGSADLHTVARADGFAVFPAGDRTTGREKLSDSFRSVKIHGRAAKAGRLDAVG